MVLVKRIQAAKDGVKPFAGVHSDPVFVEILKTQSDSAHAKKQKAPVDDALVIGEFRAPRQN